MMENCDVCQEGKATLECYECERGYCEDCAEDKDGACCIQTIRTKEARKK